MVTKKRPISFRQFNKAYQSPYIAYSKMMEICCEGDDEYGHIICTTLLRQTESFVASLLKTKSKGERGPLSDLLSRDVLGYNAVKLIESKWLKYDEANIEGADETEIIPGFEREAVLDQVRALFAQRVGREKYILALKIQQDVEGIPAPTKTEIEKTINKWKKKYGIVVKSSEETLGEEDYYEEPFVVIEKKTTNHDIEGASSIDIADECINWPAWRYFKEIPESSEVILNTLLSRLNLNIGLSQSDQDYIKKSIKDKLIEIKGSSPKEETIEHKKFRVDKRNILYPLLSNIEPEWQEFYAELPREYKNFLSEQYKRSDKKMSSFVFVELLKRLNEKLKKTTPTNVKESEIYNFIYGDEISNISDEIETRMHELEGVREPETYNKGAGIFQFSPTMAYTDISNLLKKSDNSTINKLIEYMPFITSLSFAEKDLLFTEIAHRRAELKPEEWQKTHGYVKEGAGDDYSTTSSPVLDDLDEDVEFENSSCTEMPFDMIELRINGSCDEDLAAIYDDLPFCDQLTSKEQQYLRDKISDLLEEHNI